MKLSQSAIEKLRVPKQGKKDYYDDAVRGFGVRVSHLGYRSYFIRQKRGNQDTTQVLGPCSVLTFAQVRERAVGILAGKLGFQKEKGAILFQDLSQRYWQDHVLPRNSSRYIHDKGIYRKDIEAAFGRLPLDSLDRVLVTKWHNQMQKLRGTVQANRRLTMLHHMFVMAEKWGFTDKNPAHGVTKFPEKSRERFLSDEELPRFVDAVQQEPEPFRSYYMTCLYTGARPGTGGHGEHGEARCIRWSDVDFERREWTIKDTKNKTDHVVPLVDEVVALLQTLPRKSEFIFAGRNGKPVNGFSISWKRVLQRAKLVDFHLHDIRRTFGAILANRGMNMQQIMKAMNHKSVAAAQIYQRIADRAKVDAVEMVRNAVSGISYRRP